MPLKKKKKPILKTGLKFGDHAKKQIMKEDKQVKKVAKSLETFGLLRQPVKRNSVLGKASMIAAKKLNKKKPRGK